MPFLLMSNEFTRKTMKSSGTKVHCVIPDCQVKPGHSTEYLARIGKYIAEKKPDVIVQIGDFADMPSLSSYDKGKKSYEGRRYRQDIVAARDGMQSLMQPIEDEIARLRRNKERLWKPECHLTLGNHEFRILRTIESEAILDGTISISDLDYEAYGFRVHDFLSVVSIDGIRYSHYFTSGVMGRPVPNARQLVIKKLQSCVMGHNQHWDVHRTT